MLFKSMNFKTHIVLFSFGKNMYCMRGRKREDGGGNIDKAKQDGKEKVTGSSKYVFR